MKNDLVVGFRFKLQQKVKVVPLKLEAIVLARCDQGCR